MKIETIPMSDDLAGRLRNPTKDNVKQTLQDLFQAMDMCSGKKEGLAFFKKVAGEHSLDMTPGEAVDLMLRVVTKAFQADKVYEAIGEAIVENPRRLDYQDLAKRLNIHTSEQPAFTVDEIDRSWTNRIGDDRHPAFILPGMRVEEVKVCLANIQSKFGDLDANPLERMVRTFGRTPAQDSIAWWLSKINGKFNCPCAGKSGFQEYIRPLGVELSYTAAVDLLSATFAQLMKEELPGEHPEDDYKDRLLFGSILYRLNRLEEEKGHKTLRWSIKVDENGARFARDDHRPQKAPVEPKSFVARAWAFTKNLFYGANNKLNFVPLAAIALGVIAAVMLPPLAFISNAIGVIGSIALRVGVFNAVAIGANALARKMFTNTVDNKEMFERTWALSIPVAAVATIAQVPAAKKAVVDFIRAKTSLKI